MDNEFLLYDRLEKIRSTIKEYGEKNFYISFSGGKDSCVLSALVDEAVPENNIPRVYVNTGIEYRAMVDFVKELQKNDARIVIIAPSVPIKQTLEKYGYPFKSKEHSARVATYRNKGCGQDAPWVYNYLNGNYFAKCPAILKYQFTPEFTLNVSDKCCNKLKKEPLYHWEKNNNKTWTITGIMKSEGGQRITAKCLAFSSTHANHFNPLSVLTKDWEEWYINERDIKLCSLYYPPYNFKRTGCKGCPFAIKLQQELDTLEQFFPLERKQCETIWKPVYAEYRRLGYRLRKDDGQMNLFDISIKTRKEN